MKQKWYNGSMKRGESLTKEQLFQTVGTMKRAPFYNRLARIQEGEYKGRLAGYDEKKKQWVLLEGLVRLSP